MKKNLGMVMRISTKMMVILTEKGDFLEIPTPNIPPKIGDTIEVNLKPKRSGLPNRSWWKYTASAAALLLGMSLTAFYVFALPNMAVASVALDMDRGDKDQSIELLVNNDGKVIEVRDMSGGTSIPDNQTLEGKDAYQAIDLIIENAAKEGNLKSNENLVLARLIPLSKWMNSNLDSEVLKTSIQNEMSRLNLQGNLVVGQSDEKIREKALDHGMSVNSHLIYERCQERGIDLHPDAIQSGNLQKALSDVKTNVTDLFPNESIEIKLPQQSMNNETHNQDRSEPWKPTWNSKGGNPQNQSMMGPSNPNKPPSMNMNKPSSAPDHSENSSSMNMSAPPTTNMNTPPSRPQNSPQNPPQQSQMPHSNALDDTQGRNWNSDTEHDQKYQSSQPMNSWQDSPSNHDSNQGSYRSW
ncbi:hypothetical protein Desdi_1371 [Desulfitobacterium dichloroeliminans LMG P-21439]|uniref:RsgI N-terminal anti-sigma domain-containing protein n=1 Tax=Desulfitobacterium dichloroeliminans (strain LMG P-21439 / DCA1) TaxID=871963 RepID=L0F6Q7_DESDL|nr:anti-sigma factor domain-containing protein [Desulfitobacterium dichloroeliminans]AGA68877.1 hypothetical protein Desdi_1371 [Desulfitobacterium dichloroeliminans LMG P-21439]